MTTPATTSKKPTRSRASGPIVALWASAFVLGGMVLQTAARLGAEPQARADVSEVGDLTVATLRLNDGGEAIAILSRRDEVLMLYSVKNGRQINRLAVQPLDEAFTRARASAANTSR